MLLLEVKVTRPSFFFLILNKPLNCTKIMIVFSFPSLNIGKYYFHCNLNKILSTAKQMQHLKQRVEELVKRIQQLVNLLRDARISIPPHLAVDSSRPLMWSNKFNQEDGLMLFEKAKKSKLHLFIYCRLADLPK